MKSRRPTSRALLGSVDPPLAPKGIEIISTQPPHTAVVAREEGEAIVDGHGDVEISLNSRALAKYFMEYNPEQTDQVQAYLKTFNYRRDLNSLPDLISFLKSWIHPHPTVSARRRDFPQKRYGWSEGESGAGNTWNDDSFHWKGEVFIWVHFKTDFGDPGAIILWYEYGNDARAISTYSSPEVYLGDFPEFMDYQWESDPESPATYQRWDEFFGGGLIEAWNRLGVFTTPGKLQNETLLKMLQLQPMALPEGAAEIILSKPGFHPGLREVARARMMFGA